MKQTNRVARFCTQPRTAAEIGKLIGGYSRQRVSLILKGLDVEVVGTVKTGKVGRPARLYKVRPKTIEAVKEVITEGSVQ